LVENLDDPEVRPRLIALEARPCAGESDAEIVAGAWDIERINRRYVRHLKILDKRPGGALQNDATALLRQAAAEAKRHDSSLASPSKIVVFREIELQIHDFAALFDVLINRDDSIFREHLRVRRISPKIVHR
jgi:hypothetical protein